MWISGRNLAANFMNNSGEDGLFTVRACIKGEAVAHEDVVNYLE
jgi:hypothetical protein